MLQFVIMEKSQSKEKLFDSAQGKSGVALREEKILEFWKENNIFEKSLEKPSPKGEFVFYDGPPFATGVPHYGHILPTTMKDVIPRYKTMKGYHVERVWGWDCHGLPIENIIEKEHGFTAKQDIEEYGIGKFNKEAEKSVLRYADVWKDVIPRVGRWVDMERDYKTMDYKYTESIWWAFKELFNKGLAYEGYKSMHLCPRCETTLSNFEVTQGYKDVTDISVTAKFRLVDEPGVYILAWTTTPWTLPGNAALAVGADIQYVKVKSGNESYIVAKERLEDVFRDKEYEVVEELNAEDLVGKSYEPLFDYYSQQEDLENREQGWKIYTADFVNIEDGTGIVHIAPAFGEDDMNLEKEKNLPFIQHVATDGKFKDEVLDFKGQSVKPKDEPQSADIEIIKHLAHKELLFAKQKITHSYPHCWRCETPLLNYAATSWFVKVTSIVNKLLVNNKKTTWVPAHMRDGRFGKWLEGARDWAISRARYWGAPLPVWRCENCEKQTVIGGIEDLQSHMKQSHNHFLIMRHGGAQSNKEGFVTADPKRDNRLTEKGKEQVNHAIELLKIKHVDLIIASDLVRTKETAHMVASGIGLSGKDIVYDPRIREIIFGELEGKSIEEHRAFFSSIQRKFIKRPEGGEHLIDVKKRITSFLYDIDKKYSDKTILIISHDDPLWMLAAGSQGLNKEKTINLMESGKGFIETGEFRELPFTPLPHDEQYILDLHRPYIDEITLTCECGSEMKRIPEVFDCWFESGSMPYASLHYPFENKKRFHKRFPADFIAEGVDQTRGWFYSLMVLSTALFNQPAFKNVAVNGMIMGEDGKKMSKRLKNYPGLDLVLDTYGADALRLFLMNSPAVHAEEVALSEKGVHEVLNKVMNRLWNVVSFYEMYSGDRVGVNIESENVLDTWIIARLHQTIKNIEAGLEHYEFDKASRPIEDFVEDLSTWYIRRSRDRFKGEDEADKQAAFSVTQYVLLEFSKAIAPITPFIAESIFQKVRGEDCEESVHLEKWPSVPKTFWGKLKIDSRILEDMKKIREIVSLGLEARQKAGIKVRQPLQKLFVKIGINLHRYEGIIKDELNVKEVVVDIDMKDMVGLDLQITPLLKQEGDFRELLRGVQDIRKKENLTPSDSITITIETDDKGKDLITQFEDQFKKTVLAKELTFSSAPGGHEIKIDNLSFKIKILAQG